MPLRALTHVTLATLAYASAAAGPWAHAGQAWAALERGQAAGAAQRTDRDAPQQTPQRTPQGTSVAPRTRVAGLDSLRVTSRVRFRDPLAAPHVFEVSLAFPGRARLALRSVGGGFGQRVLRYARCGELYGFGLLEATSTRIEGAARVDELLSIEARLAAFLWPEAHTWSGEGNERRAVVAGLGTLVAELAPSASVAPADPAGGRGVRELRPVRIRALRADGTEVEALEVTGWRQFEAHDGARAWPQGLCLSIAGTVLWDEEVLLVDRPVPWSEEWFVPPDRRSARDNAVAGLRAIDLSSAVVREVEVPRVEGRPSSIDAALAFAGRVAAEERERGLELDRRINLVLSATCEPRTVRLVLADENAGVPDGWRLEPPRPAWLVFFDAVEDVGQRDVDRLLFAAPTANPSLMLIVTGESKGGVQLVLVDAPH